MKLWLVEGGYGIWVVRAATPAAALAFSANAGRDDDWTGWEEYGLANDEMKTTELTTDGDSAVLDHMYG